MTEKFDDMKNKMADLKGQAMDVNSHVDSVKAKGKALMDKVKELGIGGGAVLVLGLLAQFLFPWWVSAIVAFWVGYWVAEDAARSFAYGFVGMFLLWSIYAGFQSSANGALMTNQIAHMFKDKVSGTQLIYLTGMVGGLVGGLGASSGTLLRHLLNFPKRTA
jgi:hypothetical protein